MTGIGSPPSWDVTRGRRSTGSGASRTRDTVSCESPTSSDVTVRRRRTRHGVLDPRTTAETEPDIGRQTPVATSRGRRHLATILR